MSAVSAYPSANQSLHAAPRATLAGRPVATPPLLPPIHSQSHLLELIPSLSAAPTSHHHYAARSPLDDTNGSTSASETDVVLTSSTTPRRAELLSSQLRDLRQRLSNASSASSTRRVFRNGTFHRSSGSAPSHPRTSLENTRSPELPPIDTSDNGLGGLTSLLYQGSSLSSNTPASNAGVQGTTVPSSQSLSSTRTNHLPPHLTFVPSRPFVESPSPPINNTPTTSTAVGSTAGNWARIREFDEAIAPLRNTPPPPQTRQHQPPRLSLHARPHTRGGLFPPILPHPFEEIMSPSTASEDNASEHDWEETQRSYRDELRYIHSLNTVLDEREGGNEDLTPILSVPSLPPILPSPLLVSSDGLELNETPNPSVEGRQRRDEETEWEADEVPSAWLREARRHLINPGPAATNSSSGTRDSAAPLLELPNFSTTSLGLVDFPHSSSPSNTNPLSSRISTEQLRQLPTEQLRQLRRFAVRSITNRSRSRSSLAPSFTESTSDGEGRGRDVGAESVVSNEDIVVGVPPMLDEPFEGSFWRTVDSNLQHNHSQDHRHHHHHRPQDYPLSHPQSQYQPHSTHHHNPPQPDIHHQPRVSLPPIPSGLDLDGGLLASREVINDASSNASVRSAVPSSSPETEVRREQATEPEIGAWREHITELVEGSLGNRNLPALALTSPPLPISPTAQRSTRSATPNRQTIPRRSRSSASHARPASTGSSETFLDPAGWRQQFDVGRLASAGRDNSLALAVSELEQRNFRATQLPLVIDRDTPVPEILGLTESTTESRAQSRLAQSLSQLSQREGVDAFRMLDSWFPNSTGMTIEMLSRELNFMERVINERTTESPRNHRRTVTPLWDTEDPLSDFLVRFIIFCRIALANLNHKSDVGFDNSYEALLALGEQLGVVPRGISDSAFEALGTSLFRDLEPALMSPALPAVSNINPEPSPTSATFPVASSVMSSPASPSRTSFTATRMTKKESGKWVAQCSICLEEYKKEDICVTLECTHFFHQLCVRVSIAFSVLDSLSNSLWQEWLRSASTCPLCRHPLPR